MLDIAFPSRLISFKTIMIVLFGLLLTNIYLMLSNYPFVYTVFVLLISVYLAIYVLYRFATVFLNRNSFKKELFYKYYKSNLSHLKKSKPIEPHISEPLRKLKVITLKHISNKDYPELNEYMLLYFNLLKVTLFNNQKQVQEYYTEYVNFQDIIGHINEFSLKMLHENNALYGLSIYNNLLKHINYYKIVCIHEISYTSTSFIEAFTDLSDKLQIKRYLNALLYMSNLLIHQTYLFSIVDLSYCRLARPKNMIHYFAERDMYEKIYDSIVKSDKITKENKSELIESMRYSVLDFTSDMMSQDVDDFRKKERFHKDKRVYNLDIKGEPISLLFIRFIENNDIESLGNYHYAWNNTDTDDKSIKFAGVLTLLSVINNISNEGNREYFLDINIEPEKAKTLIKKCDLLNININGQMLNAFYDFIINHYISDLDTGKKEKGAYGFHPKFRYKQEVVDTLFSYLYWKNNKDKTMQTIATEKNLKISNEIEKIITSMCKEIKDDIQSSQ